MRTHLLSILALLPLMAGAAASAQFAPAKPSPPRQFSSAASPHDSRIELPAFSSEKAGEKAGRQQLIAKSDSSTGLPAFSAAKAALQQQTVKMMAKKDSRCYTMRSYQYTADADAPQPSGQTTCQASKTTSALIVIQPK